MSSPCQSRSALHRTGALAVVFGLVLAPLASTASAQTATEGPVTVRALLAGDGSVSSVSLAGGGEAPTADALPVTLDISQSTEAERTTTRYSVENTTLTKKSVSYLDAADQPQTVDQNVAMPLVAQLAIRLPATRTDVEAPGARITTLSDGSMELLWSLVLFSPIGAPVADVRFTAGGTGEPLARLDVAAAQPNSTQGLSATGQAANATVNGNGILSVVANGANDGLLKLAAGVGQLLDGLDKLEAGAIELNAGIAAGADGASKLAAGSAKAKAGSGELAAGLGKLATGGDKAADGAASLSSGLAQISGGLDALSAAKGLPAALDGAKKLQVGVDQLSAGLGDPATKGTILNGLAQVGGGLDGLAAGLPQAKGGVDQVAAGLSAATKDGGPADQIAALVAFARTGIPGCAPGLPVAQPTTPCEAANTAAFAVSHPAGATGASDAGGVKQQLQAASAGLGQVSGGLAAAVTGVGQLQGGLTLVNGGVLQVAGGLESGSTEKPGVAEGLDSLVAGLTTAVGGVGQLATGAKAASAGSAALADGTRQLADGAGAARDGSRALDAGIGQIADGQKQVADGLPAAVVGSGQLADGIGAVVEGQLSVEKGLGDVRGQAIEVLRSQFTQGTTLARQQLAGLDAASALVETTPGAATTTYVLTQSEGDINATLASSTSDDEGTSTAALIAGAIVLLLGGAAGGYLSGRRGGRHTTV